MKEKVLALIGIAIITATLTFAIGMGLTIIFPFPRYEREFFQWLTNVFFSLF